MGLLAGLYEPDENKLYPPKEERYVGTDGAYLRAVYDYEILAETHDVKSAFHSWEEQGMKAFVDLLPVESPENLPEDSGPSSCDSLWGEPEILCKNERQLPTGTTFYRAASLLTSLALEKEAVGITGVLRDWLLIKAFDRVLAGKEIPGTIYLPQNVTGAEHEPENIRIEKLAGPAVEAFKRSQTLEQDNFYNVTPGYNPNSREAYKTIAYEIFLQYGEIPDRVYLPVGEGDVISGIREGFEELRIIGWGRKQAKIFAVLSPEDEARVRWLEEALEEEQKNINSELSGPRRGMFDLYFATRALKRSGGGIVKISREMLRESEGNNSFAESGSEVPSALYAAFKEQKSEDIGSVVFVDTGKSTVRQMKQ